MVHEEGGFAYCPDTRAAFPLNNARIYVYASRYRVAMNTIMLSIRRTRTALEHRNMYIFECTLTQT